VLSNACDGLKWPRHPRTDYDPHPTLLKPTAMQTFLQRVVDDGDEEAVVLFIENDVMVNFDGSAEAILRRFDAERGDSRIVLGVEPFCWLSRECTLSEMQNLYPEATSSFSRCPAFINSGLYIGEAKPLLKLLASWTARTEPGDQERLAKAVHASGGRRVHLDRRESIFATAMTATMNAHGGKAVSGAPCSGHTKCLCDLTVEHAWMRDNRSSPWHRPVSYQAECGTGAWPGPLFIHGNGPAEVMLPALRFRKSPAITAPVTRGTSAQQQHPPPAPSDDVNQAIRVIAKSCLAHSSRWEAFKGMWGWRLAYLYVGDPTAQLRFQLRNKLLTLRVGDLYDSLAPKFFMALAFYARNFRGPVFHVDDDAKLAGHFKPQVMGIDYGGPRIQGAHHRGANRTSHWDRVLPSSYWYRRLGPAHNGVGHSFAHGGCGVYLSARAIGLLVARWNENNTEELFRTEIYDDVVVADVLATHDIFVKHVAGSGVIGDKPEQRGR